MSVRVTVIASGTKAQWSIVEQVVSDLTSICDDRTAATCVAVSFDSDLEKCKGLWTDHTTHHSIALRPTLVGASLYAVFLHELGHALGLDHTRRGIMAPKEPKRRQPLSIGLRRKWCAEIAFLVATKRAKEVIIK